MNRTPINANQEDYSLQRAVMDGILITYDRHKAENFEMKGNCNYCGRVGDFMHLCTTCVTGDEITIGHKPLTGRYCYTYMIKHGHTLNPYLLARLKGIDESSLIARTVPSPVPVVQFRTEFWRWIGWVDVSKYKKWKVTLDKLEMSDWEGMKPNEVEFLVTMSRPTI